MALAGDFGLVLDRASLGALALTRRVPLDFDLDFDLGFDLGVADFGFFTGAALREAAAFRAGAAFDGAFLLRATRLRRAVLAGDLPLLVVFAMTLASDDLPRVPGAF
ncbi:MAG: hypothetical protein R6X03_04950 [Methyloceanibacter sp.]